MRFFAAGLQKRGESAIINYSICSSEDMHMERKPVVIAQEEDVYKRQRAA